MGFKSDIEIAQETTMAPITEIADKAGIDRKYLEQYGNYKAKIDRNQPDSGRRRKDNHICRSGRRNVKTW